MQVKKYYADDMQHAIRMIKEELGSGAVIISTRKVRKGSGTFGMFGKFVLEVTAARDETYISSKNTLAKITQDDKSDKDYLDQIAMKAPEIRNKPTGVVEKKSLENIQGDILDLKELVSDISKNQRREVNDEATVSHLRYEVSELKNMINALIHQSGELKQDDMHENLVALYQQLCFNGVEDKFAKRLIEEVNKKIPRKELNNFSYVKVYVARMFMQVLQIDDQPTKKTKKNKPRILTFLGPTGVGKTTSLAKIASKEKIGNPDLKIGLITIDTYRIAAVQQLQEYARIIKVPFRVVNDQKQLVDALEGFKDMDLILIDSAGRSQRDETQMADLRKLIKNFDDFTNLLVLSSTTKDSDLVEITKRFSTFKLGGILFTKLDESTSYGSIFNHSIRFKLPLTYLTTGQNVPEDIEDATRERLIDLLMNISGEMNEAS
ncbi:MAG: flagellar biosynthesis protein FlhF [Deltaproteobacteria bacterium]|nr:flagellar biosynthesis protein FlhF [Deltaproteobacteria bacterium]